MTLLPADNTPWPPPGHADRYSSMAVQDAWYSGDVGRLAGVYGSAVESADRGTSLGTTINPRGSRRTITSTVRHGFWANLGGDELDTRRHLPVPEDIARHSARVLYSERLQIRVNGPVQATDGPLDAAGDPQWLAGDPMPETDAAQRRLDALLEGSNFDSLMLAAGEIGSALGSYGLRIVFNREAIPDRPILSRSDADSMIPVYSWGILVGVMFWQVVLKDGQSTIWRHIELHQGGKVYHGLYRGTQEDLGERKPLAMNPATAALAPLVDADSAITLLREPGTTGVSIPNMLPDPTDRMNNAGRSDFTPAVIDLFDAIDKVYTQMLDTIDDAKSRIIVARSLLEKGKAGEGASFDLNQRIFTKVNLPPAEKESGGLPIEKIQFEMHIEEYLTAIDSLIRKCIEAAGFNSRSDAGEGGRDVTATEINSDDALSMGTRDVKIRYAMPRLQEILSALLRVDVEQFRPRDPLTNELVKAFPVTVTFPDAIQPTKLELANIAKALKEAGAASVYELVKTVNPEWTDRQIAKDVDRIMSQSSVIDPVSFGTAGQGVGAGDGV